MKAGLLTGTFVLLLLAGPAPTYALGLPEYGPAAADQPVLSLSGLNGILAQVSSCQPGVAVRRCPEAALLTLGASLLLLAGYGLGRRGLRPYLAKVRRAGQHLRPGVYGPGLLSPR